MTDEKIIELFWSRDENAIKETEKKYGDLCHFVMSGILPVKDHVLPQLTVKTAWQRIVYRQNLVREKFPDCMLKHEAQRTYICSASVRMVISDELYLMRIHDGVVQPFQLVVHQSGQCAFRLCQSSQRCADGHLFI